MSDAVRRLLEQQGILSSHLELKKAIEQSLGIVPFSALETLQKNMGALAQFDELSRELKEFERLREAAIGPVREFEAIFRRPDVVEAMALAKQFTEATNSALAEYRHMIEAAGLQTKMLAMQTPWLSDQNALSSAFAFGEIQALGLTLNSSPYGKPSASVRGILGDWRDVVSMPSDIASVSTRLDYYSERGVSSAVRSLSPVSFEEAAEIAGFDGFSPVDDDETEDSEYHFARNAEAFDQLQRFETAIRGFIAEVMTSAFGEAWIKRQLPPGMRENWESKRKKAVEAGQSQRPLIEYADFSDYLMIVERNDNWKAFKPTFRRVEDVRESLQRLYPVRISTMHARMITNEDKVLLFYETKRILKAIKRS